MTAVADKVDKAIDAYVPPAVDESLVKELDLAFGHFLPDNLMFDADWFKKIVQTTKQLVADLMVCKRGES